MEATFRKKLRAALILVLCSSLALSFTFQSNRPYLAQKGADVVISQQTHKKSPKIVMMPQSTPLVPFRTPGGVHQWMDIYGRFQKERKIFVSDFIDDQAANKIIATLLFFDRGDDNTKPVSIYFNSPGALQKPAWAVYDTMQQVRYNITTINLGLATGMGAFLCAAGHKRIALPNARFLVQYTGMEDVFQGQASDIALEVKQNKWLNNRMVTELMRLTGQTEEQIRGDLKRDFYLSAAEAVRYGLIDRIPFLDRKAPLVVRKGEVWSPTGFGAFEGEKQTYQDKWKQVGKKEYIVDPSENADKDNVPATPVKISRRREEDGGAGSEAM